MENKLKHLEFIQSAVGRMASNLFLLKGWAITLIAALFALATKETEGAYSLIAFMPATLFWALDGYFLAQERRFRSLYDHVRKLDDTQIDFSMNTQPYASEWRNTWLGSTLSLTLTVYYLSLIFVMLIVMWLTM